MANEKAARRYAQAVFSLAGDANSVERVGRDLASIAHALDSDPVAHEFYRSPIVDRKEKERALAATFGGKVDDIALHTLLLLVRKRRELLLSELLAEYRKLEAQARGAEPLTITTAHPLPGAEVGSMVARLERVYGKKFDVNVRIDPSLIGGVRLMMGDRRVDGSVAGRLDELSRLLFAKN